MAGTMKYASKWSFVASNTDYTAANVTSTTAFTAGLQLPVLSDGVKKTAPIVDPPYAMGVQTRISNRGRIPTASYAGTITLEASPECLNFFLPMMSGTASTPWILADTMTKQFDMLCSDGADTWTYRNCFVTSWSLKGASGGVCELSLNVVAVNEDLTVSFASAVFTTSELGNPYLAAEVGISLAGATLECDDFELTVDRAVTVKNRHSLGATAFLPGVRTVMFKSTTVWDSTAAAAYYAIGNTGVTGAVITLSRGGLAFVATTSLLVPNDNRPQTGGTDGELMYGFEGVAKSALPISTLAEELSMTSDVTP